MTDNTDPQVSLAEEERDILFGIINRFIGYFTRDSQRESQNDPEAEYPFVPMDTRQVYQQIKCASDYLASHQTTKPPFSFIDIGCGIGNVLLFAEMMDFEVCGIEKDEYPFKIGAKLIGEDLVSQADIWDFTDYHKFDVIYYFRPFHQGETQRKFEKLIEEQLKPGGILIANRKMSDAISRDLRFQALSEILPVWVKKG